MNAKLRKMREWMFASPIRKAISIFVIYLQVFLLLRFLVAPNRFTTGFERELIYALLFGAFTAFIHYSWEVNRGKAGRY